nr:hypothetical protein [Gluconacetobacter takamatsuzukensis]
MSGFKIRRSRARTIPGGQTGQALVDGRRWEAQQPQDFVRGVADEQGVDVARPRQENRFVVVGTSVSAPVAAGGAVVPVVSNCGFAVGDRIQVMLDRGENVVATIVAVGGGTLEIAPALPGAVGFLGGGMENMVLKLVPDSSSSFLPSEGGV